MPIILKAIIIKLIIIDLISGQGGATRVREDIDDARDDNQNENKLPATAKMEIHLFAHYVCL
jgi:hypothetical protein